MTSTIVVVLAAALLVAALLIFVFAARPSGGLTVPRGSHVVRVDERDFNITAAQTTLPAGNVLFVDTNHGPVAHELVMWQTSAPAADLPLGKDGRVNEDSAALNKVLDSGSSLQPTETRILSVSLDPGHYVLVCNLPGHYRAGMHVDITVH
jgi:uncharacterized cupredoxin-like copper-binding protein